MASPMAPAPMNAHDVFRNAVNESAPSWPANRHA